jgi:hypothetical protein
LLIFEDGVDQAHFFVKFLEYHDSISEKENKDYLVANFGSLEGPYSMTSHALYSLSNKFRELFDLTYRVSLNDHELRKYFSYILSVSSERLARKVTIDSDIILFLESIDLMRDQYSQVSAKCWLPKTFVRRVKCIMTCKASTADSVMSRFFCHRIKIKSNHLAKDIIEGIWKPSWTHDLRSEEASPEKSIDDYRLTRVFNPVNIKRRSSKSCLNLSKDSKDKELLPAMYNNKVIEAFQQLPDNLQSSMQFAETFFSLFLLTPSNSLVDINSYRKR